MVLLSTVAGAVVLLSTVVAAAGALVLLSTVVAAAAAEVLLLERRRLGQHRLRL